MLPQAAFLVITWHFAVMWLKSVQPEAKSGAAILVAGIVGAVALIAYVSYLASNDPFYEIMRRYGIYLYFLGTAVAQLTLTFSLERSRLRQAMIWIMVTPFVLGIYNLVQKNLVTELNSMENRIEWIVALLMQAWFVTLYLAWRNSNFQVVAKTG